MEECILFISDELFLFLMRIPSVLEIKLLSFLTLFIVFRIIAGLCLSASCVCVQEVMCALVSIPFNFSKALCFSISNTFLSCLLRRFKLETLWALEVFVACLWITKCSSCSYIFELLPSIFENWNPLTKSCLRTVKSYPSLFLLILSLSTLSRLKVQ